MKHTRTFRVLGLASLVAGLAGTLLFGGCSSDDSKSPPSGGDGKVHPPARPSGASSSASTEERNFALQKLFLGHTDPSGATNPIAWQKHGYDLDDKITTKTSTDVCKVVGDKGIQEDGPGGVDNSFGKNVLPLLRLVLSSAETDINGAITDGSFTALLDVKGLTNDPKQTATGVSAKLYGGAKFSGTPTFGPSDNWPVLYESVHNGDVNSPKVQFSDGYINGGVWVNGGAGDVILSLSIAQGKLAIRIQRAIVTFEHSAPGEATNGIIAGVIDTEEFIDALKPVLAGFNGCGALATVADRIRATSDILSDGSNRPDTACNGISVGIGFTAKQIALPKDVAAPIPPVSGDPCAEPKDAGRD
ncbi:hypothetical protein [Pendulispora albinea]|uniref:Lipoprotein n=1 Tax=Pendulispora albinea TaxID=2741071 RepID=A0ABZ2M9Q3_9BACT